MGSRESRRRPLLKLLVIGCCVTAAVVGILLIQALFTKDKCDRAAEADMGKVSASLERLVKEMKDLNCPADEMIPHVKLQFMIGPYYGWRGPSEQCRVRMRKMGTEVWGCSAKDTWLWGSRDERPIYRISLTNLAKDLPAVKGPCSGQEYADGPDGKRMCYTSSIVTDDCRFVWGDAEVPEDVIRTCKEIDEANSKRAAAFESLANQAINPVGVDLFKRLVHDDVNLFLSPLGLYLPLAMAYGGARGNTEAEMGRVLRVEAVKEGFHPTLGALPQVIGCSVLKGNGQLKIKDGLWAYEKPGIKVREEYKKFIRENYHTNLETLAVGEVPKDRTAPRPAGGWTFMILKNSVYFDGKWKLRFSEKSTKDASFFMLAGKEIRVPTMHNRADYLYMEGEGFQGLELPYKGSDMSMVIFLPRKKDGLPELERSLTAEKISEWIGALSPWPEGVIVYLPRFEVNFKEDLIPPLKAMGIADAFSPGGVADFSGQGKFDPKLPPWERDPHITQFDQLGFLKVNEEGTEAYMTSVICERMTGAEGGPTPQPKVFRADHPFLLVVRHRPSNCILFIGRLAIPL
ncbi:MAG: serpin family protein [Pseudomonadota bacterium]